MGRFLLHRKAAKEFRHFWITGQTGVDPRDESMKKSRIIIDSIESRSERGRQTLSAKIHTKKKSHSVWFRYKGPPCPLPGDVFLFAVLGTAMRNGRDIVFDPEQAAGQRPEAAVLQERLLEMEEGLSRITVQPGPDRSKTGNRRKEILSGRKEAGTGFFFAPDVDSFYTIHRHFSTIEQLVFVHWFDPGARFWLPRVKTSRLIRRYACNLGKLLTEVETNLNCFFLDGGGSFDSTSDQVCAEAAIGVLLSGQLNRIYLDSRNGRGQDRGKAVSGSEAWLDTPLIQFRRHLAASTHKEKVVAMVKNEELVSALRLCWENPDRNFNCGRCPECTRNRAAAGLFTGLSRGAPEEG